MVDKILYIPKDETIREVQTGVYYPDGTIHWFNGYNSPLQDLTTRKGQQEFIEQWITRAREINNFTPNEKPRFIRRTVTTKFSIPTLIVPGRS